VVETGQPAEDVLVLPWFASRPSTEFAEDDLIGRRSFIADRVTFATGDIRTSGSRNVTLRWSVRCRNAKSAMLQ
jgi:hypothetical protein